MSRQSHSNQQHYLHVLKRRQHTSLWLEWLACAAGIGALVCFIDEQVTGAFLAWQLGVSCLLLALVFIVTEALDAALERSWRVKQQQTQGHPQQGTERASHKESSKKEQADDSS